MLISPGQIFPETFPKGAIILVDKPLAWTSFDVVGKIRYHLCKRLGQNPLVEDDDIDIKISPDDLRWDVFRASGAGGQHVNRTESAVRVTHIPTGIVAECQQDRSQHRNREIAMTLLRSRLYEVEMRKRQAEKDKIEAGKSKIEWGSQIRSYVLDDRWVKDLRSGYKVHNPDAVLNGDLDPFLKAYLMWERNPTGTVEDDE